MNLKGVGSSAATHPLQPLIPFPSKGVPLEGKRPKFTDFPSDSREPARGTETERVAAAGVVLRRAKRIPLPVPAPVRVARSRDVNFTVFMNIYINLHFTARRPQPRSGRGVAREKETERKKERESEKNSTRARARRCRRRKPEFYPRDEGDGFARMKNLDNNLRLV